MVAELGATRAYYRFFIVISPHPSSTLRTPHIVTPIHLLATLMILITLLPAPQARLRLTHRTTDHSIFSEVGADTPVGRTFEPELIFRIGKTLVQKSRYLLLIKAKFTDISFSDLFLTVLVGTHHLFFCFEEFLQTLEVELMAAIEQRLALLKNVPTPSTPHLSFFLRILLPLRTIVKKSVRKPFLHLLLATALKTMLV